MIRQFRPEDAVSCCSLVHSCLAGDPSIPPTVREKILGSETPGSMEERAKLFYLAVYESDGQILGIAGLDMNEIRLLCVSPEHRRKGIGRSLLNHIRTMVPGMLFPDIFVYSSEQGKDFYRACGFSEKGPFDFEYGGEQLRTFFMTFPTI